MKRLTHAELAAAHDRQDWRVLWQAALPLVKLTVGRIVRGGAERTEDLLQEGALAAGEAVRSWKPLECAFSTHVVQVIRRELYDHRIVEQHHSIGSREQKSVVVLSLGDARHEKAASDDEDEDDDGSFEAALTYEGVVKPGGQFDGMNEPPEGLGLPEDEADQRREEAVLREAARRLPAEYLDLIACIVGLETQAACAARSGVPLRTVERRVQRFKNKVAAFLQNLSNSKYGREECS